MQRLLLFLQQRALLPHYLDLRHVQCGELHVLLFLCKSIFVNGDTCGGGVGVFYDGACSDT